MQSLGERAKDSKPDSHLEEIDVYATGTWDESACAIPGEISLACLVLLPSRDGMMGDEKSAEGIRASAQRSKGPNMEERKGTDTLSDETDADRKAEMPEGLPEGERRNLSRYGQGASNIRSGRRDIPTGDDDAVRGGAAPREPDKGIPQGACQQGSTGG